VKNILRSVFIFKRTAIMHIQESAIFVTQIYRVSGLCPSSGIVNTTVKKKKSKAIPVTGRGGL
jgi:hypothetical protein